MSTDDSVGARLRAARTTRGMGSRELSAAIDLSPAVVSRIETDPELDPKLSTIRRLAAVLECSPGWLAFGEGKPPAAPKKPSTK